MATLDKIFKVAIDHNASDIHVAPGEPFTLRLLGQLTKLKTPNLTAEQSRHVIFEILTDEQKET